MGKKSSSETEQRIKSLLDQMFGKQESEKFDPSKPFQVKDQGEWKTPKKDVLYVKQTRDGRHALENPDGRIVQVSHVRNVPENKEPEIQVKIVEVSIGSNGVLRVRKIH